MTIDEAIAHADLMSHNENESEGTRQFAVLCVKALHLEKQKEEENDLCVPETWKELMKREYHETKERYEKLHRAVTKYEAGTLNFTQKCSIDLLKQQKRHMGEYLHDLEIRAEIEGVNLYD